ncbi:hypothetical protein [Streptomyces rugosispiralis]|uniref:Lipoprotein n=1 Tax=Streptomyces rugosispiralis TaxID=2967341 RepID=A0ABT1V6E8_9ACTN|nr:hypothetical protein [Streptomyces rugosispiralis]MCQ8192330.1 hypothetical protein [Streptomyces rugosispiralis]
MHTRRTRTLNASITLILFAATAGALTGCGGGTVKGGAAEHTEPESRARLVADAWDGSRAAEAWRRGYFPMGDAVQLPANGFRTRADRRAYATQNFVLRGGLPATPREGGQVRWRSGGSLTLPLMGARTAYENVARGRNDGPHLTVTGARMGEMTMATSRGPATVPAWLFSLEGYATPLKRAALGPSRLPQPPIEPTRAGSPHGPAPLKLVEVAGDGRSITVRAGHGSCDDGPAVDVLETGGSVVLSGSVVGAEDGPCTAELLTEDVTVKLKRPVGDRVLLDELTGRPVPYGERNEPSPSWS